MRGKKGVKLSILLIIGILIGSSTYSVNAADIQSEEKTQQSPSNGGDLSTDMETIEGVLNVIGDQNSLDFSFIHNIIQSLAGVIDEDESYWRSRSFGTPGELRAAEILKEYWDNYISNENIGDADLEQIDKGPFGFDINHKVDVATKDDYYLKVKIDNNKLPAVPYTEFFPIHPVELSEDNAYIQTNFENAQVHIAPDIVYNLGNVFELLGTENIENINLPNLVEQVDSLIIQVENQGVINNCAIGNSEGQITYTNNENHHIYLIELERMINMPAFDIFPGDVIFVLVALELKIITALNPNQHYADAFLCSDYNEDMHFSLSLPVHIGIPGFMINGSLGNEIKNSINSNKTVRADFILNSTYYSDFESYNVVGTINGESSETIVIGAHYDSLWNQCPVDNANGVAIIFGIAKYFADKNIIPEKTIKFVALTGEEFGWIGSNAFVRKHVIENNENIERYINLDVVGQKNGSVNGEQYSKSDMSLIIGYLLSIPTELINKIEEIDYQTLSGGYGGVSFKKDPEDVCNFYLVGSDHFPFLVIPNIKIIEFHKGRIPTWGEWYHKRGNGNTKGDTLDFVDWEDVNATAKVVLTTVDYFLKNSDDNANQQSTPSSELAIR